MDLPVAETECTEPDKTVPASSHNKAGRPVWIMVGQMPFSILNACFSVV